MKDDRPHLHLVDYEDNRSFIDRLSIPEHAIRRRLYIARLCNAFAGVSHEFSEWEEEYQDFVAGLSRQEIELMIERLYNEIRAVQRENLDSIKMLRALEPTKIWGLR